MASNQIYIQVDLNSANAQANVNALNQAIGQTGATTQKATAQASAGINQLAVTLVNARTGVDLFAKALGGLGLEEVARRLLEMGSAAIRAQIAFNTLLGSERLGREFRQQIIDLADAMGAPQQMLTSLAQKMLALGTPTDQILRQLRDFGNAAARAGTPIDTVAQAVEGYQRALARGSVTGRDAVNMFEDMGIRIMPLLSKQTGIAEQKLRKMLTELAPQQVLEQGLRALEKYPDMLAKIRKEDPTAQMTAAWNDFSSAVEDVWKVIGPDLAEFVRMMTELVKLFKQLDQPLATPINEFQKLLDSWADWLGKTSGLNQVGPALARTRVGQALGIAPSGAGGAAGAAGGTIGAAGGAGIGGEQPLGPMFANPRDEEFEKIIQGEIQKTNALLLERARLLLDVAKATRAQALDTTFAARREAVQSDLQAEIQFARTVQIDRQKAYDQEIQLQKDAVREKYNTSPRAIEELKRLDEQAATYRIELQRNTDLQIQKDRLDANKRTNELLLQQEKEQINLRAQLEQQRIEILAQLRMADLQARVAMAPQSDLATSVRAIRERQQIEQQAVEEGRKNQLVQAQEIFAAEERAGFASAAARREAELNLAAARLQINNQADAAIQKNAIESWTQTYTAIREKGQEVYNTFKDSVNGILDTLFENTSNIGKAITDSLKKTFLNFAKETVSSGIGASLTQALGYPAPDTTPHGGLAGIIDVLRSPVPRIGERPGYTLPKELEQAQATLSFATIETGAALNAVAPAANAATVSLQTLAQAASVATGAFVQTVGSAHRAAGEEYGDAFAQASSATGLPTSLLQAVAKTESAFRPNAVSSVGAMGLMQLMPGTARGLGVTNAFNPMQNIMGGARYLKQMADRYGGNLPLALAAYNMGPHRLDQYIAQGRALPSGVQQYVSGILGLSGQSAATPSEAFTRYADARPFVPSAVGSADTGYTGGGGLLPEPPAVPTWSQVLSAQGYGGGGMATLAGLGPVIAPAPTTATRTGGAQQLAQMLNVKGLANLFGIGGTTAGKTTLGSVLGSQGVAGLAGMAGMLMVGQGLQRRSSFLTTAGGALAGVQLGQMLGMGWAQGPLFGAGLGLFAAGVQKGGVGGALMDIGGGALAGGMLGLRYGGPIGGLIGAAVGAGVGAITGIVRMFVQTEQERIRSQIKQVYGIDISNRQILTQIQQIVDQSYGGSVSMGIRSQQVQDLVRLYALSTGQAANMPRPMYSATIAQSGAAGLQLQPVYEGGVQVKNPYAGPTTYQYQTAVTTAQALQNVPGGPSVVANQWIQLNPQQAQSLMTGQVVSVIQQNPSAVAASTSAGLASGDSRLTTAQSMMEPLTALS